MADLNSLAALHQLNDDVLAEVVREGEARLLAQFSAATASDQRGMAWAGFMIASAAASLAGAAGLISKNEHVFLASVAFFASIGLLIATAFAAQAVRPTKFCFPGNEPVNWLPENWMGHGKFPYDLRHARIEQAVALQNQIAANSRWADSAGKALERSLDFAMAVVVLSGSLIFVRSMIGQI